MKIKNLLILSLFLIINSTMFSQNNATLQTLTILGGSGIQGEVDPYTEASLDGGQTWQPAYLTGWHPWGFAAGTNSWINFDPSPFVGLNSTADYRIRFYVPEDFSSPSMIFVIKADNRAWLSINGIFISQFDGESTGAAGDQIIAQALVPGLNEITIRLQDFGGWVGLNYRIDLSMLSTEAPTLEPSTFSNHSPVANAGEDQTFDCTLPTGVSVTLDGGASSDEDGDALTYSWNNGVNTVAQTLDLEPGTHTFILTVNDGNGATSSDDVTIVINADNENPTIVGSSEVITLWPPNHKYETINLSDFGLSVLDNCADISSNSIIITKVTSDEDENSKGKGDGNTVNDIVIADDFKSVDLRKEREGNGNGRVYTIFASVSDDNGNIGDISFQVHVPHDKKDSAIDDGISYEVFGTPLSSGSAISDGLALNKSSSSNTIYDNIQSIPTEYNLSQNYPNPFNPTTTINFAIPSDGSYKLNVYNMLGQEVASLYNGELGVGNYSFNFDGSKLSSGIYLYVLRGNDVNISKKMNLMK